MHNGDNDELPTFALHCEHGHIEVISEWLNKEEPKQKKELQQLFNNKVLLFSTTMKEIAIK